MSDEVTVKRALDVVLGFSQPLPRADVMLKCRCGGAWGITCVQLPVVSYGRIYNPVASGRWF